MSEWAKSSETGMFYNGDQFDCLNEIMDHKFIENIGSRIILLEKSAYGLSDVQRIFSNRIMKLEDLIQKNDFELSKLIRKLGTLSNFVEGGILKHIEHLEERIEQLEDRLSKE